jgi:hypothetical protein
VSKVLRPTQELRALVARPVPQVRKVLAATPVPLALKAPPAPRALKAPPAKPALRETLGPKVLSALVVRAVPTVLSAIPA